MRYRKTCFAGLFKTIYQISINLIKIKTFRKILELVCPVSFILNGSSLSCLGPEPRKYISLLYVAGTSELLRRIFSTHNIKCSFHSPTTLRRFCQNRKTKFLLKNKITLYTKFLVVIVKQSILVKLNAHLGQDTMSEMIRNSGT